MTIPGGAAAPSPQPRLFRGWWIVAVCFVGQTCSLGTLLVYTFGVFAKPLAAAFHSNRGAIALAVSLLDVVLTFGAPGAGRLVDLYGGRRVITASVATLAAALVALAFVQPPLWHLYALYTMAAFAGVGAAPIAYGRVISNWFDRNRGLALGVAGAGVGFGAFLAPSLVQFFVDRWGWRSAYLALAGATILIALPTVGLFLRGTPQEVGLAPDRESTEPLAALDPEAGLPFAAALGTRTFWLLCGIFFCVGGCVNGSIAHLIPMLTDTGMSGRTAAYAASLFGLASIAGRIGNGYLVDRFFAPRVAAVLFAGAAAGVALLWAGTIGVAASFAATLLGLAVGAESDVMPFLISRYFGLRSMATLYGCAFGSYTLGNATGRYLFAVGFDRTGSYQLPLAFAFGVLVLAIGALLTLGRYDTRSTA